MGTGRTLNKAPKTRPKKSPSERARRERTQKKRLVALGLNEERVAKMNSREIKDLLKRPLAVKPD